MIDSVEYDASQATLVHNTPSSVSSDMLPFSNHNFPVEHPVARKVLARAVREGHFRKLHQTGVVVANNRKSLPPTNCNEEEREWGRSVLTSEQLVNEERERSAQEGGERARDWCLSRHLDQHTSSTDNPPSSSLGQRQNNSQTLFHCIRRRLCHQLKRLRVCSPHKRSGVERCGRERRRGDGDSASVATNNQTGLSNEGEGGCGEGDGGERRR
ncbi:hypothetical protein BLNAU_16988 [Blattamonas nauphoetae]|uniref:Uncharacterized protein n=1 Tax=Blattamonas nauphoetae TaxID=2049346 RepID=A0ABQ9XCM2_9EUKA|nr:hypothetical protein BLNAU_16988 [Blattamonas nauphoetae]